MINATFLTISASRNAGGLFFSVKALAKSLPAAAAEVRVIAPWDPHTDDDLATWAPVNVTTFGAIGPTSFGYSPRLIHMLAQSRPNIIHVHGLWKYNSRACYLYSTKNHIPYLVSPRGMLDPWALNNSRVKKRIARILFENQSLRNVSCMNALNESELRSIRKFGSKRPVCVIPNGVSLPTKQIDTEDKRSLLPERIRDRQVLLYIGRIHPKKGLENLVAAWSRLPPASRDNWALLIVGWNQFGHEEVLQKLAKSLGVSESIHFLGPRFGIEKDSLLRAATAFVHTSYSEGLPMAVLEAWAYGLPVVMTDECNLPIGFQRSAAIRVQTNPDSILTGLRNLVDMTDPQRDRMGQAGRALAETDFSWTAVAAKTSEVYSWLLGGQRPEFVDTV